MASSEYRVAVVGSESCGKSTFIKRFTNGRNETTWDVVGNDETVDQTTGKPSRGHSITFQFLDGVKECVEQPIDVAMIFYRRKKNEYYHGDRKSWMDYLAGQYSELLQTSHQDQSIKKYFICGVDFEDDLARFGFDIPELTQPGDVAWCDGSLILGKCRNKGEYGCNYYTDCMYAVLTMMQVLEGEELGVVVHNSFGRKQ